MDRAVDAKCIASRNFRHLACGTLSFTVVRGVILHLFAYAYSHLKSCHSSDLSCKTDMDWDIQAIILACVVVEVTTAYFLRLACNPDLVATNSRRALLFSCIWFIQRLLFIPLELYFTFALIFMPFYQNPNASRLAISMTLMLIFSVIVRVGFQIIFGYYIYRLYHFHRQTLQLKMNDELEKHSEEGAGDYNSSLAEESITLK